MHQRGVAADGDAEPMMGPVLPCPPRAQRVRCPSSRRGCWSCCAGSWSGGSILARLCMPRRAVHLCFCASRSFLAGLSPITLIGERRTRSWKHIWHVGESCGDRKPLTNTVVTTGQQEEPKAPESASRQWGFVPSVCLKTN
jgi:hypothetical protein